MLHVLIIQEEAEIMQSLSRGIRKVFGDQADIRVTSQEKEALAMVRQDRIEIVFLDLDISGGSGLGLGEAIRKIFPRTNLILITHRQEYAVSAWKIHASDFLLKPVSAKDVQESLLSLRFPVHAQEKDSILRAQCFGNFEVFAGDEKVHFQRSGSKELLAYLIAQRGAGVSTGELCNALWEDDSNISRKKMYLRTYYAALRKALYPYGLDSAVIHTRDSYAVNPDKIDCDYYHFLDMDPVAVNSYHSEFMRQYSWAEMMIYQLDLLKNGGQADHAADPDAG